jgi:hypothetical protein
VVMHWCKKTVAGATAGAASGHPCSGDQWGLWRSDGVWCCKKTVVSQDAGMGWCMPFFQEREEFFYSYVWWSKWTRVKHSEVGDQGSGCSASS